ncbi:MAG: hypothetical protein J6C33_02305 [Lachnospiraceae bacterium]|nr:hypothetical protein [Lachnospiraceae bacterium]
MEQKELYFPVNVIDRNDYITGFGPKELLTTIISFGVSVAVIICLYFGTGNVFLSLFTGIMILAVTIMLIRRDKFDESVIDKVRYIVEHYQSQKKFVYDYYNIYEGRYASDEV